MPNWIIQNFVCCSSSLFSGNQEGSIKQVNVAELIKIFVEVPNPFSITFDGIVSSTIFGVAHIITPALNPNIIRPKHIPQKLRYNAIADPNIPIILNLISAYLRPFFIKSAPNIDPNANPKTALVVNIVVLKSIVELSSPQLS